MKSWQVFRLLGRHRMSRLPPHRIYQKPATHPDAPVDAPHGKLDTGALQGFAPCQHVLVNAVHQRTVQIEKECRRVARGFHLTATPAMRKAMAARGRSI